MPLAPAHTLCLQCRLPLHLQPPPDSSNSPTISVTSDHLHLFLPLIYAVHPTESLSSSMPILAPALYAYLGQLSAGALDGGLTSVEGDGDTLWDLEVESSVKSEHLVSVKRRSGRC